MKIGVLKSWMTVWLLMLIAAMTLLIGCSQPDKYLQLAEQVAQSEMIHHPGMWQCDGAKKPKWEYTPTLMARAFVELYRATGDTTYLGHAQRFADMFIGMDGTIATYKMSLYNMDRIQGGNFQDGSVPGKIQFGSGWWFLDQKDGMEKQMMALSNLGLLSRMVGMLTDSRSFLSYPRHEYFRRTLCNVLGNDIENGMIPYTGYEKARVQQMVEDICYNNAKQYFKF